jgi:hypothetical protein
MKTQTGLDFELMGNIVHKKKRKKNSTSEKYRGKNMMGWRVSSLNPYIGGAL